MEVRFCANCNKEGANKRCGSCKFVYYCDQTCQQKDWNKHKAVCQQLKQEREDLETKTNQANQTIEPQMGIQFSTPSNTNKTETKTSQTTKNDDSETFAEPNLENMIAPLAKFMTSDSETEVMLDGCFGLLSVEICLHIFQFLDDPSLLASSQVCRAWYYLANDAQIWKTKIAEPSTARMYTTQLLVSNEEWKSLYYTLGRLDYQSSIFSFSILQEGVQASSTDHKKQSIAQTLDGVETTFWSSTGSPTTEFNEFLIYRLKQPICAVYEVSILPYQAAYQNGQPIYAPQRVQISIGFSPNHFHWKSPVFEMQNAHETQTFAIAPYFAVGGYIRIELIGKCQTQPNDELFYTVLEGVSARGLPLGTVSNTLLSWGMVNFALQHPQFLESLETIKDEMRSKYHVILDDYKVNRNPKDFFNGLSVITTKQMLPLLNAEQKKHQDLIHLYELIQGEQWKTAFTFIENNLQTLRSNEVLNLIQQYNTAYVRKYLSIMLKTPKLTKMESLKIVKIVLEEEGEVQRGLGFLLLWMADRKLTLSQELGDFVRKYDPMLAARIYLEVSVPDKVVDCYIQMKNYRRAVVLAMLFKSDIVKMLETLNQRNRVDALCFAVELGEAKGGSPIPLEKVASILQIEYGIDEWDLRKVIRKACEECLEAQPEENNNRPQGLYAHPVFGNNMDVVDNYEFVDEAEDDDLAEDEEEEDE